MQWCVNIYNSSLDFTGVAVRGSVLMQTPEFGVNHVTFHQDDHIIALCTGCDVIIYEIQVNTYFITVAYNFIMPHKCHHKCQGE